jgi:acyl-coenzyme A thioesterase PaaI-like protein
MLPGYFWSRIPERWRPAALRLGLNWFPAYRATGARLTHVSADLKRVVVRLPLKRVTKNGAGTMFGGSLYSATDPIYALLLAANLGPDYIVWDKSAAIRYRKPGREALSAEFVITDDDIAGIRSEIERNGSCDRSFTVAFHDSAGVVHVEVDKTIYVACKKHYKAKVASPP